jgi:hypothetical protein
MTGHEIIIFATKSRQISSFITENNSHHKGSDFKQLPHKVTLNDFQQREVKLL